MEKIIILACVTSIMISYILFLVGSLKFLGEYREEDIPKEGGCYLLVTAIILFIPIWNIIRTVKFIINPSKHILK